MKVVCQIGRNSFGGGDRLRAGPDDRLKTAIRLGRPTQYLIYCIIYWSVLFAGTVPEDSLFRIKQYHRHYLFVLEFCLIVILVFTMF